MTRAKRNIELIPEEGSVKLVKRVAIILAIDTSEGQLDTDRIGGKPLDHPKGEKGSEEVANLITLLPRKNQETPPVPTKVTGKRETRIIALACSTRLRGQVCGR
jgi:hypothetical protein